MAAPDFWSSRERAQKQVEEVSQLRAKINPLLALEREAGDLDALKDLAGEETDQTAHETAAREVQAEYEGILKKTGELELRCLLGGEHDRSNAFVTIHAG